ncbi:MAG: PAS domain-containing sensor histidine kinase [Pseudomonadaceae bacterium]|nr:PAS domain-containing sensor histidine kinase [Pseudomonadaceae bacterium]
MDKTARQWLQDNAISVLDAVVDAIITIDSGGHILSANQSTFDMFGYRESELLGQQISVLMPEPYRSSHQAFVDRYLETGNATIIGIGRELTAVTSAGTEFPIYLAIKALPGDGETYFTGIVRDLSLQKASELAIAEQREHLARVGRLSTMGEMTASIAHEINQPLTAIAMYAQASIKLLQRPNLDRDKLSGALQKLNTQALRAGSVIERIQRFVRNEGGQREMVDMPELLAELQHLAAGDARAHGIEVVYSVSEPVAKVFCDPVQIQQVALNLLRNAIDAMDDVNCSNGNRIDVAVAEERSGVSVTVADVGPGIEDDQQDLVFGAFHSTKSDGMGMGLSICRSIIRDHSGELDYENNVGPGVTFRFWLPYADDLDYSDDAASEG